MYEYTYIDRQSLTYDQGREALRLEAPHPRLRLYDILYYYHYLL